MSEYRIVGAESTLCSVCKRTDGHSDWCPEANEKTQLREDNIALAADATQAELKLAEARELLKEAYGLLHSKVVPLDLLQKITRFLGEE